MEWLPNSSKHHPYSSGEDLMTFLGLGWECQASHLNLLLRLLIMMLLWTFLAVLVLHLPSPSKLLQLSLTITLWMYLVVEWPQLLLAACKVVICSVRPNKVTSKSSKTVVLRLNAQWTGTPWTSKSIKSKCFSQTRPLQQSITWVFKSQSKNTWSWLCHQFRAPGAKLQLSAL